MRRRRIREIVAAAASATWTVWPNEVVVSSDGRWTPICGGVHVTTPVRCFRGTSKRATTEAALVAFGLDRAWPACWRDERERAGRGASLDVLAQRPAPHPHLAAVELRRGVLEHLREPVALPEEARRG